MSRKHPVLRCFGQYVYNIRASGMLVMLLLAPVLCGAAFRYGLPLLYEAVPALAVLRPYAVLFDALLLLVAPYMALFASALLALEERDNGICVALLVTPLGRAGYAAARFVLPALLAAPYGAVIGILFCSVSRPLWHTALLSLPATCAALSAVLFIPAFAKDKLSGMAMGKLCGFLLLTVVAPAFLPWKWQPLCCWLPSYWFYRFLIVPDWLMATLCAAVSAVWCAALLRRFFRRAALR